MPKKKAPEVEPEVEPEVAAPSAESVSLTPIQILGTLGLSKHERAGLIDDVLALPGVIAKMFGPESDGGRHVTSAEWKALGKRLLKIGARILLDLVD